MTRYCHGKRERESQSKAHFCLNSFRLSTFVANPQLSCACSVLMCWHVGTLLCHIIRGHTAIGTENRRFLAARGLLREGRHSTPPRGLFSLLAAVTWVHAFATILSDINHITHALDTPCTRRAPTEKKNCSASIFGKSLFVSHYHITIIGDLPNRLRGGNIQLVVVTRTTYG